MVSLTESTQPFSSESEDCLRAARTYFPELACSLYAVDASSHDTNDDLWETVSSIIRQPFDQSFLRSRAADLSLFMLVFAILVQLDALPTDVRYEILKALNGRAPRAGVTTASALLHALAPFPPDQQERNRISKRLSSLAAALCWCQRQKWSSEDIRIFYRTSGEGFDAWARREANWLKNRGEAGLEPRELPTVPERAFQPEVVDEEELRDTRTSASRKERLSLCAQLQEVVRERQEKKIASESARLKMKPPLDLPYGPMEVILWLSFESDGSAAELRGLRLLGSRAPTGDEVEELLEVVLQRRGG